MPNDAKLGMVVGIALVIAVAVFFVRKDAAPPPAAPTSEAVTVAAPSKPPEADHGP